MILRLIAHFSYIEGKKLYFTNPDESSQSKLISHCSSGITPYTITNTQIHGMDFIVSVNRVYDDIRALVGLECIVHVKITPFSFASKFANNSGQLVSGTRLVLDNIAPSGH